MCPFYTLQRLMESSGKASCFVRRLCSRHSLELDKLSEQVTQQKRGQVCESCLLKGVLLSLRVL